MAQQRDTTRGLAADPSTQASSTQAAAPPPQRLLVATDYSPLSVQALLRARALCAAFRAELHVLHVWEAPYAATPLASTDQTSQARGLLDALQQQARESMKQFLSGVDLSDTPHQWFVVSGPPQARVLEHAEQHHCDWIVLGTHGRRAVGRWFVGSVAQWVVRNARRPVLVVSRNVNATPNLRATAPAARPTSGSRTGADESHS